MLDKKKIDKIDRLSILCKELKSESFREKYGCSYELAKEVYIKELEELEEWLKKEKESL
ncbi:MAG: hypothetical protein ACRDAG_01200 [Cetobacterium somerae]|uniref:hypothetical protein n=1 Tax=Cetobacterium somerae TaxID=188913 RepID=UPI003F33D65D